MHEFMIGGPFMFGFEPFSDIAAQIVIAQGKTPLSADFVNAIKDHYINRIDGSSKFKEIKGLKDQIWRTAHASIIAKYPEATMANLLSKDDTKDTVKSFDPYYLRATYIDDGKIINVYYMDEYLPPKEELEPVYVLRGSDDHKVDLTQISHSMIKLRKLNKERQSLKDDVRHNLNRILRWTSSVEDLYELMPDLKKAKISVKKTATGAKEVRALRKLFRDLEKS